VGGAHDRRPPPPDVFTRPRPVRPRAPNWFSAECPARAEGEKIADYLFVLADRADMKWPLSTNFYKLISRTADKGKPQYTLPSAVLLTPDKQYYWHVRAKDEQGVWGLEQDVEFHASRAGLSRGRDVDFDRTRAWDRQVEGQSGRSAARKVPRLRQRREGLFRERCAVHRQRRHLEGAFAAVPGELHRRNHGDGTAGPGSEVVLPAANKTYYAWWRWMQRASGADRRTMPSLPPGDLQQAGARGQGGAEYRGRSAPIAPGDLRKRDPEVANFWTSSTPSMP